MIIRYFWAFIQGYLVLVVSGERPERFINLALTRGVLLWDLVRVDERTLLVKVQVRSFRFLRHIVKRTRCRVGIRSRHGLPFFLYRLRRRKMLVGGALVFAIILYYLAALVWTVDVRGTSRVSPALVKKVAASAGLRPGVLSFQVPENLVVDHLLEQIPELAYAEVEASPRARIKVVEKVLPEKEQGPCDLVASKEGMIKNLLVLAGVPQVKEGELIQQGQILISGVIQPPLPEKTGEQAGPLRPPLVPRYLQARGIVRARIWYRSYGEAFQDEVRQQKSGRVTRIVCIKMDHKEITIKGPRQIPYALYTSQVRRSKFPVWRNITLPVEFVTIEACELQRVAVHRSKGQAVQLAVKSAWQQIRDQLPVQVAVARQQVRQLDTGEDNLVRIILTCETIEDVARVRPLHPLQQTPVTSTGG